MNILSRIKCYLFGHTPNPYGGEDCIRCGRYYSYHEYVMGGFIDRVKEWLTVKTRWFKKCEDCGKRFGRHNDSIQHIPF